MPSPGAAWVVCMKNHICFEQVFQEQNLRRCVRPAAAIEEL